MDTGDGSSFVRVDTFPPGWEAVVTPDEILTFADANGRPLRASGQIPLVVRLGDHTIRCTFVVCERLAAPVILRCEFNDKFVEAIYTRRKLVELEDDTKIPIVRKLAARAANSPTLPAEQEYSPQAGRISPRLKVSRAVHILGGTQMWVHVTSGRTGLSVIEVKPTVICEALRPPFQRGGAYGPVVGVQGPCGEFIVRRQALVEETSRRFLISPSPCHGAHGDAGGRVCSRGAIRGDPPCTGREDPSWINFPSRDVLPEGCGPPRPPAGAPA